MILASFCKWMWDIKQKIDSLIKLPTVIIKENTTQFEAAGILGIICKNWAGPVVRFGT